MSLYWNFHSKIVSKGILFNLICLCVFLLSTTWKLLVSDDTSLITYLSLVGAAQTFPLKNKVPILQTAGNVARGCLRELSSVNGYCHGQG